MDWRILTRLRGNKGPQTLKELRDRHLQSREGAVTPGTLKGYRSRWRSLLSVVSEDTPLTKLDDLWWQSKVVPHFSDRRSVLRALTRVLKAALNDLSRSRDWDPSLQPALGIRLPKSKERRKKPVPSPREVHDLYVYLRSRAHAKGHHPHTSLYTLFICLWCTGRRINDWLHLSHSDFTCREDSLYYQIQSKGVWEELPVPRVVITALEEYLMAPVGDWPSEGLLFPSARINAPWPTYGRRWREVRQRLNIRDRITLRSGRHLWASTAFNRFGMASELRNVLLGHKPKSVEHRHYLTPSEGRVREASEEMAEYIYSLMTGESL